MLALMANRHQNLEFRASYADLELKPMSVRDLDRKFSRYTQVPESKATGLVHPPRTLQELKHSFDAMLKEPRVFSLMPQGEVKELGDPSVTCGSFLHSGHCPVATGHPSC